MALRMDKRVDEQIGEPVEQRERERTRRRCASMLGWMAALALVAAPALPGVQAFSLSNFHLGYGRANSPWEVGQDIGENGETMRGVCFS